MRLPSESPTAHSLAPPAQTITAKYGSKTGIGIFRIVLRLLGLRTAYLLLWFVVPWYLIFRPSVRRSTYPYLSRRFPDHGAIRRGLDSLRCVMEFARVMVDQGMIAIKGPYFLKHEIVGQPQLKKILTGDDPVVLVTSHVGNWKVMVPTLELTTKPVNLLLVRDPSSPASGSRGIPETFGKAKIIDPSGPFGGLVDAAAALTRGELVSVMGDRSWGGPTGTGTFLGDTCHVPISPHRLAQTTGARLVLLLVARVGYRRYRVVFREIPTGSRRDGTSAPLQDYLAGLEEFLEAHPYSWFNYFDFWQEPSAAKPATAGSANGAPVEVP